MMKKKTDRDCRNDYRTTEARITGTNVPRHAFLERREIPVKIDA